MDLESAINSILEQFPRVTRAQALMALRRNNNDIVDARADLIMSDFSDDEEMPALVPQEIDWVAFEKRLEALPSQGIWRL